MKSMRLGTRFAPAAWILGVALFSLSLAPVSKAQRKGGGGLSGLDAPSAAESAQKVDPKEEADYKMFFAASEPDKKIQLGEAFLAKYPMSRYSQVVYGQLVTAYYAKQDWAKFYATSDQAVSKFPDDVDVLTLVGWVIPHVYDANDPEAEKKLSKGEGYEKHALEVIPTIPKPPSMTDDQFATAKNEKLMQAHSGLGLIYFRQGDQDDSVKELTAATQGPTANDATDFYVLGVELQRQGNSSDAAAAFTKCSQIPGGLQDRCKQSATQAQTAK
jgi:tetratricopeptide (TPR) repeat protein